MDSQDTLVDRKEDARIKAQILYNMKNQRIGEKPKGQPGMDFAGSVNGSPIYWRLH